MPCKKTRDFAYFPFKIAIFEWGFWDLKVLPPPWTPGTKQCEIGGFQKGLFVCLFNWSFTYMCLDGLRKEALSIPLRGIFTESQQPCGTLFYTWDT